MADELIAALDEVDAKPEIGALVIRAGGKSFCAGGEIATLTSVGKDPAAPDAHEGMGAICDSLYRLAQCKVPTVAAVRGSAVGAGMDMLLATDLQIIARDRGCWPLPQARGAPGRWALRHSVAGDRP
ncbi:enoyl-CoA hydratase/isomerase family protein [Blastococcus sp. HT6-30]|uniref:enoyl-CoA hydratase/isomerase family protein n=1 Tax=Blastococcus sp. HT6-30 TaxID=3144843 RepID=UPI003219BFE4